MITWLPPFFKRPRERTLFRVGMKKTILLYV